MAARYVLGVWLCAMTAMRLWLWAHAQQVGALLNRAPHFLPGGDMARFALREDTQVGAPVYRLRGADPEGGRVAFSVSGDWLTVERDSGVVTLRRALDREEQGLFEVIISITDEGLADAEPNTVSLRREVAVLDVNDNAPVFLERPYAVAVPESAAVGSVIFSNITVADADGGVNADVEVTCVSDEPVPGPDHPCSLFGVHTEKLAEGLFGVRVRLLRPLDFERQAAYQVVLRARDGGAAASLSATATASATAHGAHRLHSRAALLVAVLDVQDQPPRFLNAPYSATIAEGTPPGTSVLAVRARDGDEGSPRSVRLALEGDHLGCFALAPRLAHAHAAHADLVTSGIPLDREHPDILHAGGIYSFSIRATELINNELPGDTATSQVTIIVTDVDDQMPTFNQKTFHINVSEDIGSDTPLPGLALVAHDRDVGDNARFRLRLRAASPSAAAAAFAVQPRHASGRTPVVVKVVNASGLDYDVDDPERRRFALDVVALVDGPQGEVEADAARVHVALLDANDHAPRFESATYRVAVGEDAAAGAPIATFTAVDRDSGAFGRVHYALRGFGAEVFRLQPATGRLTLANVSRGLDFEQRSSYSLTLEARDGGGRVGAANLFVEVEDVNDNAPAFEQREYSRIVREGATAFEPKLFVRATDADGPEQGGGKVFYSIVSKNSEAAVLFVEPVSGEVKLNSPARAADTSRGQYELTVRATDAGEPPLWSEARVQVRVGVAGNQRPVFRGNRLASAAPATSVVLAPAPAPLAATAGPVGYRAGLPENAAPGTPVLQVAASDPDGQDALLTYHLVAGARDNFVIDSSTGLITVAPYAHLDLENGVTQYNIIVHAVDAGSPIPETATSTVEVNILDVNNKPPVFPSSDPLMYVRYISEATPVGEIILNVTAYDPDSNVELQYSIVEPIRAADRTGVALKSIVPFNFKTAFAINSSTGQLSVAHQLEHEAAAVIVLTVQAEDLKALEQQKASIEVTVHIQANDDDKPFFTTGGWTSTKPIIYITVPEERPIGTTLLTLAAHDPILNIPIRHFKQAQENDINKQDYFEVGTQSGDVVLNRRLDYEALTEKEITWKVSAISSNKQSSDAVVVIVVEDINDNSPKFSQQMYTTQVPESTRYPERILTVSATDGDTNSNLTGFGSIRYSLTGENARLFVISNTGVISVAPNATLDHERYSSLRFTVIAADTPQGGANQRKSTAEVFIDVLDVNDNTPSFGQESYSAVIPENVAKGTVVLTVTANDPDEGMGGVLTFEFLDEGEANGLFAINNTTGRIVTQKPLTGKGRSEPYNLLLLAQDAGNPSLSTEVPLNIYIGDVFSNDGVPTFIRPTLADVAQISENSSIGSPVFQVIAVDPDAANTPNGRIIYKFLEDGTDALAFNIDEDSGLISTKRLLDREERENYTLIIVAQDKGSPPQQATRLFNVRVLDVDDHTPLFQRSLDDGPFIMTVEEEVDVGTKIGYVEAYDKDSGENALIDYSIIYGNEQDLFNISRTSDNRGLLTVAKRVDREAAAEHTLTVKCFKKKLHVAGLRKAYNRQDPSEIQIHIQLEDIDDNRPKFLQDNITIGVRLNVPVDTSLLKLEAIDIDENPAPIMYYLLNTTFYSLALSVMDIVSVPADLHGTFQLNNVTGYLHTAGSMLPYADGYFELHIMANNTDTPGMEVYASVKVFVLRDRDLLKFVFNKPPSDVQHEIFEFQREVEKALLLPVTLNIYDMQFYAKEDGSLDFSSTSSCFQLVGRESYDITDMESLMTDENNSELKQVYKIYGVHSVKHCTPPVTSAETSLVQMWVLAIAAFIAIGAFLSVIAVCCLYARYKRISRKQLLQEMPRATISNVGYLTNHSNSSPTVITPFPALSDGPRMYDGLTIPINHDNMSYHSFPAQ